MAQNLSLKNEPNCLVKTVLRGPPLSLSLPLLPHRHQILLNCCLVLWSPRGQTEEVVKTPARRLGVPTRMRRSMSGLLAFSARSLGNDLSQTKASDLYRRSPAGPGMFTCSSASLLFISPPLCVSPPPCSHLIRLSLCCPLSVSPPGPLFHPSLSPFLPVLSHRSCFCNVAHQPTRDSHQDPSVVSRLFIFFHIMLAAEVEWEGAELPT